MPMTVPLRTAPWVLLIAAAVATSTGAQQTPGRYALESATGLRLHNVTATPVTHEGKKGVRVVTSDEALKRQATTTPEQREAALKANQYEEQLALVEGVAFGNGTIEAEIAGAPRAGAGEGARGFVGIAFRVSDDLKTYDAFYLRPTNGRAEDQIRRNHSAQYISHPMWPWFRLRNETPKKYESYVDLVPNAWTKVKIEVRGTQARLFVHDQPQPTLIVSDVKTGAAARGGVALWIDNGTEAHFRNLSVTAAP
jgi:hypothetical protein